MTNVQYKKFDGINVISLTGGNHYDMGKAYGSNMHDVLLGAKETLVTNFNAYGITYQQMVDRANMFYERYSHTFKDFLNGMASGSGLTLDDVNILNGMETLNSMLPPSLLDSNNEYKNPLAFGNTEAEVVHCSFISIPPLKTVSGFSIIGRNYDFTPEIYGEIANNLTVTILNDLNTIPTAIIGMPGQIYCPSCVNQEGLFMELNNGMPSGGYVSDYSRESMLINMLQVMQNSETLDELSHQMLALQSDYSLIVSTSNKSYAQSYEYSSNSSLGMKPYSPSSGEVLAYTNYYLNQSWGNEIPVPTDATTWEGVTRRDNLLQLANSSNAFDLDYMKQIMAIDIDDGGACWYMTIYQIIHQPDINMLSLRRPYNNDSETWVDIDLNGYFNNDETPSSDIDVTLGVTIACSVAALVVGGLAGMYLQKHYAETYAANIQDGDIYHGLV
jgi:hypothetical protein